MATAAALPTLGLMKFVPAVAAAATRNGCPEGLALHLATAFCYVLAGATIGYVLERHVFVWAFLLCVLGVHWIADRAAVWVCSGSVRR